MNPPPARPLPIPTAETAHYWGAALEGTLKIQHCRACARHQFYPRRFCTQCLSEEIEWVKASGFGRVYTYTVCHVAAHPAFAGCVNDAGYTHESQCYVYSGPDTEHTGRDLCFDSNGSSGKIAIVDVTVTRMLVVR